MGSRLVPSGKLTWPSRADAPMHAAEWPSVLFPASHRTLCGKDANRVQQWVRVDGLRLYTVTCRPCKAALVQRALEVSGEVG